jgi:ATP-dependent RNA helicase DDX56/DBP9
MDVDRYHAVQEFNRGVFDYLIATDESGLEGHDRDTVEEVVEEAAAEGSSTRVSPSPSSLTLLTPP